MGKKVTISMGIILLLLGVLGFISAMAPYDQNGLTELFGLFVVDPIQNVIHLVSGVVALLAGSSYRYSRWYLQGFGIIYAVMALAGFIEGDTVIGLFGVNLGTNLLHAGIAIVLLVVGFGGKDVPGDIYLSTPKPPGRAAM